MIRISFIASILLIFLANLPSGVAEDSVYGDVLAGNGLKDLYFGEALFDAYQGEYFDAISRLDTELAQYHGLDQPELNSLYHHIDNAEFSVGDFELYYRMNNRASRAIKAVIEGNVESEVRNEAIYRLAKIYYQTERPLDALQTIEKISGDIPEKLQNEEPLLRAQIYIATGKFSDAIKVLKRIEGAKGVKGYAGYNLAVAMIQSGEEQEGIAELDKVGQISSGDEGVQAIRDKANLVLGFRLLEAGQSAQAKEFLERVRLDGPFSNKALLGAGWAAAAMGSYDRALVPWTMLSKRNVTDKSVQESFLGVPYAYGKLDIYGRAAILYGQALDSYNGELKRLDASITSIREGKFLKAVTREEHKSDRNWLINLRELPDAPETYYLMQLMASNDFQESLKNYFDLTDLGKRLEKWRTDLDAYEEIIKIRSAYYEPLLPSIEATFRTLDSKMKLRVEQRDRLANRMNKMLISPSPDILITSEERIELQQLDRLGSRLERKHSSDDKTRQRISRLRGIITYNVETEYDERFTKAAEHLAELDQHVDRLKTIYGSFVRTRQAATLSYRGYDAQIQSLRIKIREAVQKISELKARQGHMLEVMATNELELRRQRIEEYQVKARFAMAESYDRATKAKQEQKLESHAK